MDTKPFLFLATADEAWIARNKEALLGEFELNIFRSGADCKAALTGRLPDVLVLDTGLGDVDAYALHRALRDDFDTGDIYQLLLCTEEEAGREDFVGSDFVLRPFLDAVLFKKLALLKKTLARERAGMDQMAYAQSVAMTAMSSMGDLGVVMEFMTRSFACRTIQAVGQLALEAMKQYELDAIIHFVWEGESYTARTNHQEIDPLDREHLAQMRPLGRLLELNRQMIVNYEHTSILIREMPDDNTRCGRIRDNIATLCEGIESRVVGLLLEHDNLLKQQGIRYAVFEIRDSVANLYDRQMDDMKAGRNLIGQVSDDFEDAFLHLALAPEVENQMVGLLVELRQKLTEIWSRPSEVEARLQRVISSLETLAGEVAGNA
jgi:CheY-like chemotaxis protein